MQKFLVVMSFLKTVEGKDEKFYAETWCRQIDEALSRVRLKLAHGARLYEAWFCEWQNPDAPMEPLWSSEGLSAPDPELLAMVVNRRAKKIEGVLKKGKKIAAKLEKKTPPVPLTVAHAKKPYAPYTVYAAVSWRDWLNSQ